MRGQRCRLKTSTLAIVVNDGQNLPITIPAGDLVQVVDGWLSGARLLAVEWEGKTVMMFTTDIREHGERLDSSEGKGAA
jgi:hypothetical protein